MVSEEEINARLGAQGQALDQRLNAVKSGEENCVGIRLDVFRKIIEDIDADPQLAVIFGTPVSSRLGLMAVGNDLKISELKLVQLDENNSRIFLSKVRGILKKHLTREAK